MSMLRAVLTALLLSGVVLAGCTSNEGNPDLPDPYGDPIGADQERNPDFVDRTPVGNTTDDGNATDDGDGAPDGNGTDSPGGNTTGDPHAIMPIMTLGNLSGPAPARLSIHLDVDNPDGIYFTWALDFSGDGNDETGDSRDLPLTLEQQYGDPGVYNLTFSVVKRLAQGDRNASVNATIVVEPGPGYDEICPTDPDAYFFQGQYLAGDGNIYRETNHHPGLQRPDLGPDCPAPDTFEMEGPNPEPPSE